MDQKDKLEKAKKFKKRATIFMSDFEPSIF